MLALFLLTACGGEAEPEPTTAPADSGEVADSGDSAETNEDTTEPEEVEPTPEPTQEPTEEPTPEPTATDVPPTATPEPTAVPSMLEGGDRYEDEVMGVAFDHPANWNVISFLGVVLLAGDEELITEEALESDTAPVTDLFVITTEEAEGRTPLDILNENEPVDYIEIIQEPEIVTVAGLEAAQGTAIGDVYENGSDATVQMTVVVVDEWAYIIMATMEDDASMPMFAEILESMTITGVDEEAILGSMFGELGDLADELGGTDADLAAQPLAVDSVYVGPIDQAAAFSVTVEAGMTYVLIGESNSLDLGLKVYNAAQEELIAIDNEFLNEPELGIWTAEESGEVRMVVDGFGSAGEAAIAFYQAESSVGSGVEIVSSAETFPAVFFIIEDDELDLAGSVTDADGNEVESFDNGWTGDGERALLRELADGTYTANAVEWSTDEPVELDIHVANISRDFVAPEVVVSLDEVESAETDTLISSLTTGTLYEYALDPAATYVIVTNTPGEDGDAVLNVFDAEGTEIVRLDDGGGDSAEFYAVSGRDSVVVLVEDWLDREVEFSLIVATLETTTDLTLPFSADGELVPIVFTNADDPEIDVSLTVNDAEGTEYDYRDRGFSGEAELLVLPEIPAGDYTAVRGAFLVDEPAGVLGIAFIDAGFFPADE